TAVAQRYWTEAGVSGKVDLRIGPALDTLNDLQSGENPVEPFDFAFIDADKGNYANYYNACMALLRPGGVIALDNTLWSGRVIDPSDTDTDTEALRVFNRTLHEDDRIDLSLLPV